ncbi:hypothetical protein D3Y57_19150 [Sphingomonas paeninsulae]|uniref:Uncharacterized protein n=1 Tax=Sphingomonas paeninsulae TaxID=2319844 RepID=A0A494TKU9_SPHPE|nr:hypothetical protein [Sphingomonas paeninsulae]AYJ87653.1 hypothetical protein D3Y57_19150 [Sphingomonas paeninsulae]
MSEGIRTPELEAILIDGISDGIPLRQLCRTHGIGKSTVYDWMADDKEFAGRFARAREIGFDAIAADCLDIADDVSNDTKIVGEDEREVANTEWISRSKLRVETRLKLLAKWDPKRYGDKIQHTGDGGGAIGITITSDDAAL